MTGGGNPGFKTGYSGLVGGSGYVTVPNVSATGGGGSGFTTTAILTGNSISSIVITNKGSNYARTPSILFTPTREWDRTAGRSLKERDLRADVQREGDKERR